MLRQMEATSKGGEYLPFSVAFVTADRKRGTGGEIIRYPEAILARSRRKAKAAASAPSRARLFNRERNITAPGSGQIRKVHIDLIIEFNGEAVV